MSDQINMTQRTKVGRKPERASYDRTQIYEIIDSSFYGVIAFFDGSQVHAIPTLIWRKQDSLYIHGSHGSRLLQNLMGGIEVCVSITLIDGIVLARSAMAHSMNYRSVCLYGKFKLIAEEEKDFLMESFIEHWLPGRWNYLRQPTTQELAATLILELPITEAVLKARRGDVIDYPNDLNHPVWAGVVPLALHWGQPQQTADQPDLNLPGLSIRDLNNLK